MPKITIRTLKSAKPQLSTYFIRDSEVKGFSLRVYPSGTIKYVAEVWYAGKSHRRTIGTHPILDLHNARREAITFIHMVRSGNLEQQQASDQITLGTLFQRYLGTRRLKPSTVKNHNQVISYYLSDWLKLQVNAIDKHMVEKRFTQIRDKGIAGGRPTYSQATKTMRILSALMNYAMADELIDSNPVDVLKQKRIDRSIRKREHYLNALKVRELLNKTAKDKHPVTLAVHLMLHTGLRRNEALRIKWQDVLDIDGIQCLLIADTKNHRPHYIPVTKQISKILESATNSTQYLFPSPQKQDSPISDVRPTLKRLCKLIDTEFRCHDLRRTFATRASEVGLDYLTIKRLLNHKSNDITAQYIQWNSRQNLMVMREALTRIIY